MKKLKSQWGKQMTETEKAIRDFCGHHADWWPSTTQVQEMLVLAQPEQEPVAFEEWHKANYMQSLEKYGEIYKNNHVRCRHQGWLGAQSLSPQRTWTELTDEEVGDLSDFAYTNDEEFVRNVEAKLKEKNNG